MPQPDPIPNDSPSLWQAVIADMQARERLGMERYGTPVQAFNGRDALKDAYEECLDQAVYLKQSLTERDLLLSGAAPPPSASSPRSPAATDTSTDPRG